MRFLQLLAVVLLIVPTNGWAASDRPSLGPIQNWLLLLNNDLESEVVDEIAASNHDMVVVDFLSSQHDVASDKSAPIVQKLRRRPNAQRRLVIAYLNIGQAESYRKYWQKGWRIGKPSWVLGLDPDGWQDNYPVAYWSLGWKSKITGANGLISSIQAAGFDGVYLDWVGGFEDESVMAAAKRDGVNAKRAMIEWVKEVSAFAKAQDPTFIVVAQNAAALLSEPDYLSAIDGVAHEDIWFTGAADGPEGDCPVPRTRDEVGSAAFLAKLSPACKRSFDRDRASAMRFVGEEDIVPLLQFAHAEGKTVLTVDYALHLENIASTQEVSRSFGFVPFTGARNLKAYVAPFFPVK